jgi:hypothetical protein
MPIPLAPLTPLEIIKQLELLKNWGVHVLAQGSEASPEDLREIIAIRCSIDVAMSQLPEDLIGEVFFLTLQVDQACSPDVHTLLYLSREAAAEAAASVGSVLRQVSWYGVHDWAVSRVLGSWTSSVNRDLRGPKAHPAEVLQAYQALCQRHSRATINEVFHNDLGEFLDTPDPLYRDQLRTLVLEGRGQGEA